VGERSPTAGEGAHGCPHPSHRPPSPLLVCVGDLMVDVAVEAPALARGGDVPGAVRVGPGGSAANVAAWAVAAGAYGDWRGAAGGAAASASAGAASVGARARLVAGRGDDLGGRLLAAALAERGIELVPEDPAPSASGAMLVVMEAGERTFVADPGANLHLDEADVAAALDGADAVFVSGYPLLRPATRAAATAAAAAAGRAGVPAVVDAASWPLLEGGAGEPVLAAAELAGTLLANRDEAATLAGRPDPGAAGARLAARVGTVVVKCGPEGVLVCAGDRPPVPVPAPAVAAVDVTGAGDAFAAAFLAARAGGADPVEAARAGTRLAAAAVTTRGAWPPPSRPGTPGRP
jgi:ribokinase